MAYELKLSNFEGPLDLLLHLISKAKIEIKDIFVSEITEQYLSYMSQTDTLDMESASDFLQMAATLLYIKSRSLLPGRRAEEDDLDENGLTPEEQLVARLNEYRRYKMVADELKELEAEGRQTFYKLPEELMPQQEEAEFSNNDVSLLMDAFLKLMENIQREEKEREEVVIYKDRFSIHKQMKMIMGRLTIKSRVTFAELLSERPTREELAVTFMSLLELLHDAKVAIRQHKTFGEIFITRAGEHESDKA